MKRHNIFSRRNELETCLEFGGLVVVIRGPAPAD